jgi:hypothetical protein
VLYINFPTFQLFTPAGVQICVGLKNALKSEAEAKVFSGSLDLGGFSGNFLDNEDFPGERVRCIKK